MPEYLAPGVYVEEIQTGNKPIEGVSTSTTGLVGITERGPVNVPSWSPATANTSACSAAACRAPTSPTASGAATATCRTRLRASS